ncbi:MAG: hypothetical protein HKN35_09485 [Woeseia sp.]|nr:FAD-dependent monooxygenase [Woeseia sp.]MBT8097550.1 FAD-dependent monooxygenase [Woeseia sp.]NNE61116.1 hypothetical protein [Woeseia sp.]NNL55719.1 hypothetical protein [Woeseia sp.]
MQEYPKNSKTFDLIVIGAGFCGSLVAIKGDDLGLRVKSIDTLAEYPDNFRAEKLETDQSEALATLGLLDQVRPQVSQNIKQVHTFTGTKETITPISNHRGMHYSDTVNQLRSIMKERRILEIQKVAEIRDGSDFCQVRLDDGTLLQTRLLVLATGMGAGFRRPLGLKSLASDKLKSLTFGFYMESSSTNTLPYTAFNFRPSKFSEGLQYATFFPIGSRMRVNLFTCWDPRSDVAKAVRKCPMTELYRLFPTMERRIGAMHYASEVQAYTTRYYRLNAEHLNRIVLAGDAYQSVSPATGVGLSKCLVDAQVLVDLMPTLAESSSAQVQIKNYYQDTRKTRIDDIALKRWQLVNELATSQSLRTKLKILKHRIGPRIRKIIG